MGIVSEQICPKGFDIIWELCTNAISSKIKNAAERQMINEKLENYLSRKLKDNWFCTQEEEIDFEGLANYIRGDLLEDVEVRLFGEQQEREFARKKILEKVVIYANAKTNLSASRAQRMANDVLEMLKVFWRTQVPKELRMMSGEIVDNVNAHTDEQVQKISDKINYSMGEIKNEISESMTMSLDKNAQLQQSGKLGIVEDNINITLNALAVQHKIPDFFKYQLQYIGDRYRWVSIPVHPDACKLYPPKIKGIAEFKIDGVDKSLWENNIFDYANRHQLGITMSVRDAEKYLGIIKDPSQVEAEMMKGKNYIISPKPFPPAFPCSIMGDGKTIINYLLLRTIDISDDGVYTVTNDEQNGREFEFILKFNSKNKKTDFNFSAERFGNRGRLKILKAMKDLMDCDDIRIYLLEQNKDFICGHFTDWKWPGNSSIEDAILFYERVLLVEEYFKKELTIPNSITADEFENLNYISELIKGGICEFKWESLSCNFDVDKNNKDIFLNGSDMEYELQFDSNVQITLWEDEFVLPVRRQYACVKIDKREKLKQQLQISDIGDPIKITFVPGSEGNRVKDCLISS